VHQTELSDLEKTASFLSFHAIKNSEKFVNYISNVKQREQERIKAQAELQARATTPNAQATAPQTPQPQREPQPHYVPKQAPTTTSQEKGTFITTQTNKQGIERKWYWRKKFEFKDLPKYYIEERGIAEQVFKAYCVEVYSPKTATEGVRYAIGFPNDAGGFTTSTKLVKYQNDSQKSFKQNIGKQHIRTIKAGNTAPIHDVVRIFESHKDFLTYLTRAKLIDPNTFCIITNGLNNAEFLITELVTHCQSNDLNEILVYKHRDIKEQGSKLLEVLTSQIELHRQQLKGQLTITDVSSEYNGFKDLNEYHIAELNFTKKQDTSKIQLEDSKEKSLFKAMVQWKNSGKCQNFYSRDTYSERHQNAPTEIDCRDLVKIHNYKGFQTLKELLNKLHSQGKIHERVKIFANQHVVGNSKYYNDGTSEVKLLIQEITF
jgi:hypothetical protein